VIDSKNAVLVVLGFVEPDYCPQKRKAGASSRTPNVVIYEISMPEIRGKDKENFTVDAVVSETNCEIADCWPETRA
jgi:hypothetical protein